MMNSISIIVPIFNSSRYLKQTIESIKSQMNGDDELVLIDDGSTDDSYDIALGYSSKNVIVKHIDNHGVSFVRNLGLSIAVFS